MSKAKTHIKVSLILRVPHAVLAVVEIITNDLLDKLVGIFSSKISLQQIQLAIRYQLQEAAQIQSWISNTF